MGSTLKIRMTSEMRKPKWLSSSHTRLSTGWASGLLLICLLLLTTHSSADGIVVDKIYHPYVIAFEKELEWRMVFQDQQTGVENDLQKHQFAFGWAMGDRWFGEVYIVGEKSENSSFEVEAYELEAKWQITEQGEYWADWGLLFELEKEAGQSSWEFATGILMEKEWGDWSGTANLMIKHEWGSAIKEETDSTLGLQARYRMSRSFEPALEFYSGENTNALGPVIMGNVNFGIGRKLHWETGLLFGLDDSSPDTTFRALLEYEF